MLCFWYKTKWSSYIYTYMCILFHPGEFSSNSQGTSPERFEGGLAGFLVNSAAPIGAAFQGLQLAPPSSLISTACSPPSPTRQLPGEFCQHPEDSSATWPWTSLAWAAQRASPRSRDRTPPHPSSWGLTLGLAGGSPCPSPSSLALLPQPWHILLNSLSPW